LFAWRDESAVRRCDNLCETFSETFYEVF
jgi:hypothetical protein